MVLFYAFLINCIPHLSTAKKNKLFIIICGIQLFIIHCFKDFSSLSDLTNYVGGYNYISQSKIDQIFDINFSVRFEPGWIIFNKILSYISDNYLILFAVTSFIIVLGYSKLILLYSAIPWLSVFLFLTYTFIPSLYILRQHLALAILLFSLPYIVERKFLKFFLVVLLATSMHFTAIVFLIAYVVYPITIDKKFWAIFIVSVFVSRFLVGSLLSYLMSVNEGYAHYLDYLATNSTDFFISLCIFGFFVCSIEVSKLEGFYKLFFLLYCIALIIALGGIGVPMVGRFNLYFLVFAIILIPNALIKIKLPLRYLAVVCVMYFFLKLAFSESSIAEHGNFRLLFM